ncbi:MAG TPA: hypothetical protein VLJ59_07440 [Mycobacteriales bacterium]|nr:hypothetical protein [Mycobacteriales bacterium]
MSGQRSGGLPPLASTTRRELGKLFRSGTVGAIPQGRGRGTVLLGTGGVLGRVVATLAYLVAWRGKIVDAKAGRLRNILTPLAVPAIKAEVYEGASWYDGAPCIVLDYSTTSFVAQKVRDEIREVAPGVFLGLVFLGRRHILDFALDFTRRS